MMASNEHITENNSDDNSKALSDLIQSIQAKMQTDESNQEEKTVTESNNTDSTNTTNNFDLSSILSMFNSNTQNESSNDSSLGIDPTILIKAQQIMSSLSKEDPKKNLLLSLKPFLRESRQNKLNEYISMLTIARAFEAFTKKR